MPYILFILISLIWGSSFILIKKASLVFGPLSIAALRSLGGAVVLVLLVKIVKNNWGLNKNLILPVALVATAGNILPYAILPHLISLYGSAFFGMMVGLVPFMTIIFSIPMLKTWPTRLQIAGVISGLICLGIIFSDGLQRSIPVGSLCLAIFVPASYSFSNTYIKKNLPHVSSLSLSCAMLTLSSLVLLPVAAATESADLNKHITLAVSSVTILGIFCTGLATYMFLRLIKEKGPLFACMVTYIIPVIALVWGWVDAEPISSLQLLAVAGIITSVLMVQRNNV